MLIANASAKPEIVSQLPEWYIDAIKSIEQRKKDYTDDYYEGWITYPYLMRKLDGLSDELAYITRELKSGNRILESDFMTEAPF